MQKMIEKYQLRNFPFQKFVVQQNAKNKKALPDG